MSKSISTASFSHRIKGNLLYHWSSRNLLWDPPPPQIHYIYNDTWVFVISSHYCWIRCWSNHWVSLSIYSPCIVWSSFGQFGWNFLWSLRRATDTIWYCYYSKCFNLFDWIETYTASVCCSLSFLSSLWFTPCCLNLAGGRCSTGIWMTTTCIRYMGPHYCIESLRGLSNLTPVIH